MTEGVVLLVKVNEDILKCKTYALFSPELPAQGAPQSSQLKFLDMVLGTGCGINYLK